MTPPAPIRRLLRPVLHPDAMLRRTVEASVRAGQFVVSSSMRSLRTGSRRLPEIPTQLTTPAVATWVYLDELAMALFPPVPWPASPLVRADAERRRVEATAVIHQHGWDRDPTSFHGEPGAPRSVTTARRSIASMRFELVRYPSEFAPPAGMPQDGTWDGTGPLSEAGGYLLRHPGPPRPWLINVHGYTAGTPVDLLLMRAAHFHERLGLNVFHPVLPFHGFRQVGARSGAAMFSADHVHNVLAFAQGIWDVRRAVALARENHAPWVAVHGVSLGGFTAAMVASLPDPPDRVIAGVPFADVVWATNQRLPFRARQRATDALYDLYAPVTPTRLECRVPKEHRSVYGAFADRVTKPAEAVALWKHWDEPSACWFSGTHLSALWSSEVLDFVSEALRAGGD